ncbi:HU family DNA-binding protein [Singulisphaera sp. Ch08]|uniref:Viral histone-like protein n=1 Tax=Singulisphaera sp. Ch08 TaxID=3120278 RepID=A0AAU7CCV8_9BACT
MITFDEVEARTVRSDTSKNQEIDTTMAKKTAPKAKAPAPAPKAAPASAVKARAATKGEIYGTISEKTGLGKKDVSKVFDALSELIAKELGKKGPGQFVVPGLLKLKVVRKDATKAKQGINPFTKEPMTIKAKPARNVVKAVPMKALKELV